LVKQTRESLAHLLNKNKKAAKKYLQAFPDKHSTSFLTNGLLGVYTMRCITELTKEKKEVKFDKVHKIIVEKVVPIVMECDDDHTLKTGTAGCLYSLITLYHKIYQANGELENQTSEVLQNYIMALTNKIADKCITNEAVIVS
jgi:hypothetical protein